MIFTALLILTMANPFAVINEPDWKQYKDNADKYLTKFKGTPLTGDILANAAKKAYGEHGTDVPIELALSQVQFETQAGTKGRNPSTNPFNVYEFDKGTVKKFKTLDEGVDAYYSLIARKYLKGKKLDDLLKNFVNTEGLRYASDKDYEKKIGGQVKTIRKQFKNGQTKETSKVEIPKVEIPNGFKSAFASARKQKLETFIWNGKKYTTEIKK